MVHEELIATKIFLNSKSIILYSSDALLADLQSTTSHMNAYQQVAVVHGGPPDSRDSTPPPPLPPPPSQDTLDALQEGDNGQVCTTTLYHFLN